MGSGAKRGDEGEVSFQAASSEATSPLLMVKRPLPF